MKLVCLCLNYLGASQVTKLPPLNTILAMNVEVVRSPGAIVTDNSELHLPLGIQTCVF
jgi:hypothetical protein